MSREGGKSLLNGLGLDEAAAWHGMQLLENRADAVGAADAAARSAREPPRTPSHNRLAGRMDSGLNLDALAVPHDLHLLQVRRRADQLLGDAEPQGEVFEIGWGGHHDDVRNVVVDDGDGRFLDDVLGPLAHGPPLPVPGGEVEERFGVTQPQEAERMFDLLEVGHGGTSRARRPVSGEYKGSGSAPARTGEPWPVRGHGRRRAGSW